MKVFKDVVFVLVFTILVAVTSAAALSVKFAADDKLPEVMIVGFIATAVSGLTAAGVVHIHRDRVANSAALSIYAFACAAAGIYFVMTTTREGWFQR